MSIVLLDIEGTVCPIDFVKKTLFPYFINNFPSYLGTIKFPINAANGALDQVLAGFGGEVTENKSELELHINSLVERDVKDSTLKLFQGIVWKLGYDKGELVAPLYDDATHFINQSSNVYIYSSGSIPAQKLLFAHVDVNGRSTDINEEIKGYFDINTAGSKLEKASYEKIAGAIATSADEIVFYSDNIGEIHAALEAGMGAKLVIRPGNALVSDETVEKITTFANE